MHPGFEKGPQSRAASTSDITLGLQPLGPIVTCAWPGLAGPLVTLITYDERRFSPEAFRHHGIDMPTSIARSVRRRQADFFMGRFAARHSLGRVGCVDSQIPIGPLREPLWPNGTLGSITHTERLAAAVAVDSKGFNGIGIDLEHRISSTARESVEHSVLSPSERALVYGSAAQTRPDMLLTIAFSAKESFFKGAFRVVGDYFDFDAAAVTALDTDAGTLELTLTTTLAQSLPRGSRFLLGFYFIDVDTVLTGFAW